MIAIIVMMKSSSNHNLKYTCLLVVIVLISYCHSQENNLLINQILTESQSVYLNLISETISLLPIPCILRNKLFWKRDHTVYFRDEPIINIPGGGSIHFVQTIFDSYSSFRIQAKWNGIRMLVSSFFLKSFYHRYKVKIFLSLGTSLPRCKVCIQWSENRENYEWINITGGTTTWSSIWPLSMMK